MNPYSPLKIFHHRQTLDILREGGQPNPTHVQLILSDTCNQSCCPAGTMVECPGGPRPIESILTGDQVCGPDGKLLTVMQTENRIANDVYELRIGERTLRLTGEHPVLTEQGWKPAKELHPGRDAAVVRVRMRGHAEVEPTIAEMGEILVRPLTVINDNAISPKSLETSSQEIGGRASPAMPVRMWEVSDHSHARGGSLLVGRVVRARDGGEDTDTREQGQSILSDENQQPHEVQSHREEGGRQDTGHSATENTASEVEHRERGQKEASFATQIIDEREGLSGLVLEEWSDSIFGRVGGNLDRQEEPGLRGPRPTEGNRGYLKNNVCEGENSGEDVGELRHPTGETLPETRMGMFSGVQNPDGGFAGRSTHGDEGLSIAGIKLERGLALRPIDSIERVAGEFRVYNFHCPPTEAYILNGTIVHNCNFCAYRAEGYTSNANFFTLNPDGTHNNNPKRLIPTAKVVEILNDCRTLGVKAIQFTGGGEPTVHPDHLSLINLALDQGFECGLVTNGVIQRPGIVETTSRLSWVRYSMDAGTKETYTTLRKSSPEAFAKVWAHIEEVCRTVRDNSTGTLVGVGFVVTEENWKEVFKCAQLAKDVGAHNFRISAVFQSDDDKYFGEFYQECATLCRNTVTMLEDENFKVFNMFGDRLDDLRQAHPDYEKCHYQQVTTYIGGDLNVYRCCNTSYNDLGLIGSIKERRFKDLWLSEEKRKKFDEFDARGCPRCQFNHKNKTIAYALDKEPTHASFL